MNPETFKNIVFNLSYMWSSISCVDTLNACKQLLQTDNTKLGKYAPIVLMSRGFMEPKIFFENHGEIFGLKPRHLKALQAQEWHFTNSAGQNETFTSFTWATCDVFRVAAIKRITKFITEKMLTTKSVNRTKLRVVRGLLMMEITFPKYFEAMFGSLGLSSEMTRNLSSFAMMSCEHTCHPHERSKILSTLGK